MLHPYDQSTYQIRLEWGVDGLGRLAPADIVVLVEVLGPVSYTHLTLPTKA